MSDIDEFQRRIASAMGRIAGGLDQLERSSGGDEGDLAQALEDEKLVNAQLNERIKTLTKRQETELADLKAQSAGSAEQMAQLDLALQRLRKANDELRVSNAALRGANEAGVAEPHLINKSMMAELEALRATRAADVKETTAIIEALTPLLKDAGGAN